MKIDRCLMAVVIAMGAASVMTAFERIVYADRGTACEKFSSIAPIIPEMITCCA